MRKTVKSIDIPEGRFIVCDPCHVMEEDSYRKLIENPVMADADFRFSSPDCGLLYRDGKDFAAAFYTMYGDGVYEGLFVDGATDIGVDAGIIGVVSESLAKDELSAHFMFEGPASLVLDDYGSISVIRDGDPVFTVATAREHDIKREMYEVTAMRWIREHVTGEDIVMAVDDWRRSDRRQSFMDWLEESGFPGASIYPSLYEALRNDELSWARGENPEWLNALENHLDAKLDFRSFSREMNRLAREDASFEEILSERQAPAIS